LTTKNKIVELDAGTGAKDNEDDDISGATDSAIETVNVFTTESHRLDIHHFVESINLPENDIKILDQFKRCIQMHHINSNSAKAIGEPTLCRFFAPQ
jgi:hypothetical protein